MKKQKFVKKRDSVIIAAFERRINLNVKVVKSRKVYDRKNAKREIKKSLLVN